MNALRQNLDDFLHRFLAAVQASTRLPVHGGDTTPVGLLAAAPHQPGVGWLVGIMACAVFAAVSIGLPDGPMTPLAAAVACTLATIALTGAQHEKALAAMAGGQAALTLALLAKVAVVGVLAHRSPGALATSLLAAHTVSRFWPLLLLPLERRALVVAGAWCAVPVALMVLAHGVVFAALALVASGCALAALRWWARGQSPRAGTAGLEGAAQQVCEIAFYFGAGFGLSSR